MQSINAILQSFNPTEDKYISREFQKYGYDLSEELGDFKHKALYIKLAKTVPRPILERARNFVKGAGKVRSKPRLFMWKLAQLHQEWKKRGVDSQGERSVPPDLRRLHIFIFGNVVGIGFRSWVLALARRERLLGWVRNTREGTVEIVFEGEREKLRKVLSFCKRGPITARVSHIEIEWGDYTGEFSRFEVRSDD